MQGHEAFFPFFEEQAYSLKRTDAVRITSYEGNSNFFGGGFNFCFWNTSKYCVAVDWAHQGGGHAVRLSMRSQPQGK